MKVLHVASNIDAASGGPAVAIGGLVRAQRDVGLSPSLVLTFPAGRSRDYADQLQAEGIPATAIGPCGGKINRHPDIRTTLERLISGVDVVHIHALWEEIQHQAAVVCRRRGVPYVITPHGMLGVWGMNRNWLLKKFFMAVRVRRNLNSASLIHFTTTTERNSADPLRLSPDTLVEPLGLHLNEFRVLPERGAFRGRFGIHDRPLIVFLGRIFPKKGLEYLVPAMAHLPADVVLAAVGPDYVGFQSTLQAEARRLGIENRVIFTGMLSGQEKVQALVDADVFSLPSDHENFGISVAEAMASATPVVVSKEVAMWQAIEHAGAGCSTDREPVAIASAISTFLDNPTARLAAGQAARQYALKTFDWAEIAQRWRLHYSDVMDGFSQGTTGMIHQPVGANGPTSQERL